MDTKNLARGQRVRMQSGSEVKEVIVLTATEKFIEVEDDFSGYRVFIRFDKNGEQHGGDDPDFQNFMYGADCFRIPNPLRSGYHPSSWDFVLKEGTGEPWRLVEVLESLWCTRCGHIEDDHTGKTGSCQSKDTLTAFEADSAYPWETKKTDRGTVFVRKPGCACCEFISPLSR
jgi:hypothetical protein